MKKPKKYEGSQKTKDAWYDMRQRCLTPTHIDYARYGGRGVTICARWDSYHNFLADMGDAPRGLSLDRFPDNNGNYEPGNCRWATFKQQNRNLRSNRLFTVNGETLCLAAWCERLGVWDGTIYYRLSRGWPIERVFTQPPRRWKAA